MSLPIKYIENNMVKNKNDEWWAYYRIVPYNYSFTSPDEKVQIFSKLRQLIGQTRDGNIHLLQISTEKSVREAQERSKELAKGRLNDIACEMIDLQTEVLVDGLVLEEPENETDIPFYTGETQIEYQYYIGFKLVSSGAESMKNYFAETVIFWRDYICGINKNLMGDYETVSNGEFERYVRLERLLYSRICRLFDMQRVSTNEIGYIIEHIYGSANKPFEEYQYYLSADDFGKHKEIKYYDILKLSHTLITEYPKYLTLAPKDDTVFCAYLTISDIVGELNFPGSEILYYQQGQFDFPVDTSINIEVIDNKKALSKVRNKKKELKDLDNHAWKSGNETNGNVLEALDTVNELETDLMVTKDAMYVMSYIVRVTAPSKDELDRRCNSILDYYDDYNIKMVRPIGDMMNFHTEFIPSSRRQNVIVKHVQSDYLAALGFGAAQNIGDKEGIAIGYTKYSGSFFWLKPWLAAQGIGGTKTNSLSAAFIGSLGGGKSFFNNMLTLYAVLFGAKAVIIDPKSERGKWAEMFPAIAHEIDVINLTSDEQNKGMLDPFVIMKSTKEAESLALEVLTFLMGITIQDDKKYPVLRRAVRAVSNYENKGLMFVIDELKKDGSEVALQIAGHIESFTDFDVAHLLFSDGDVQNKISLDKRLTIIQIADLVMPDVSTKASEYSTSEMLSVAMLIAISTFCLDFIHSDKSTFKITNLDEAWSLFNVSQGAALINKLVREGRSMNAGVYLSTQNAKDLQDERIKSNIGMFFVFRSNDDEEIKQSLRLLGVDENDKNNQNMIKELENGECVMKDIYGRVNVVKIEYLLPELKHAFDTRPHKQEQETRQAG